MVFIFMISHDVHRYRDAEEPQLGSHSVTIRPSPADLQKLYADAEDTWTPAFVKLIKVGTPISTQIGCDRCFMP